MDVLGISEHENLEISEHYGMWAFSEFVKYMQNAHAVKWPQSSKLRLLGRIGTMAAKREGVLHCNQLLKRHRLTLNGSALVAVKN